MRKLVVFAVFAVATAVVIATSAAAKPRGTNGKNRRPRIPGQERTAPCAD